MSYNKKVWKSGDRITKEALNNMENGIEAAHQNSGGTGSVAIVDNLNSDSSTSALSAKQGKELNNKMPAKSIVEGGKIYLAKEDGTKLDSGTQLPASSSTPYDDTEIKTDINNIKTDLGTVELTTTAKDVKGAVNELNKKIGTGTAPTVNSVEPELMDMPRIYFSDGTLPTSKTATIMKFDYYSKTATYHGYVDIKCQGTSSMVYPKKNFTIKSYTDKAKTKKLKIDFKGWGAQNKFCLKANWIDITHARNIVSARLWGDVIKTRSDYATALPELLRTSPNQGAIDGFPVIVYSNGVYQGRYTLNIPKGNWMSNMDDTLDTHCILCGENFEGACFRALPYINGNDWSDELHDVVPATIKTSWTNAVKFVMDSSDDEFKANISNYFDVNSLIDYLLFGHVICHIDGFGKNQLFFTYDGVHWIASVYDLDSTFGLWWDGSKLISYDTVVSRAMERKDTSALGNLLYIKLADNFTDQLKTRYAELRKDVLSASHIIQKFEEFNDVCPKDIVQEDYASTTGGGNFTTIPSVSINNIQQIRQFIVDRLTYVDNYINNLQAPAPCASITLDKNTLHLKTIEGAAPDTETNLLEGLTWKEGEINNENGIMGTGADKCITDIKLPATGLYTLSSKVNYSYLKIFVYNSDDQLIQADIGDTANTPVSIYVYDPNCHISVSISLNSLEFDANNVTLNYVHNIANAPNKDVDIQANVIASPNLLATSGDYAVIELYSDTTYNDVAAIKLGSTIYKIYNFTTRNDNILNGSQAYVSIARANNGYCTKSAWDGKTFFNVAVPSTWGDTKEAIANYIQTNNIAVIINPSEYLDSADKIDSTINSYQLNPTVQPSNTIDNVVWSVSPEGIVTVDNGLVRAVKNGEAVVTATCGTKSATCNVTVSGIS